MENPYHEGELEVQSRVGEAELAKNNGRMIKSEILSGALDFIARQSMVVFATVDDDQNYWASIVAGKTGFAKALDTKHIEINLNLVNKVPADPVWRNLQKGAKVGLLFIELETRRRLKVNGVVSDLEEATISIFVEESFPLCPKYIQRRKIKELGHSLHSNDQNQSFSKNHYGTKIGARQISLVEKSDTAFLVSGHGVKGLDVSHRGGKPGFLTVQSDSTLRCPDYSGNSMFNSFGNLTLNSAAGLIIVDFASAELLQLTGSAFPEFEQADPRKETGGTNRFWTFEIEKWQMLPLSIIESEFLDYSPFIPEQSEEWS